MPTRTTCAIVLMVSLSGGWVACAHGESEPESKPEAAVSRASAAGAGSEAPFLTQHVQLTHRDRFLKAGEAYFDHESPPGWVVFQAVPVPEEGKEPLPYYSMYIAKLKYEGEGTAARIVGTEEPIQISQPLSANTCGWFHPIEPGAVIYGTTLTAPTEPNTPGYQRGTSRYRWEFAKEMRIVSQAMEALFRDAHPELKDALVCGNTFMPQVLAGDGEGYVAEGSISPDGRSLLYAKMVDAEARDLDLFVKDLASGEERCIVKAPGYDGGPFFSPDGKSICYRSDRRGNSELQVFIARLEFDDQGRVVGTSGERALTDNEHVNWAPYWHPSGKFLIYGTSRMGHSNYEVFAVEVDWLKPTSSLRQRRVTNSAGADVLPVFSDDGRWMMWTAQRGPMVDGEGKPSSQVWVASVDTGLADDPERFFAPAASGSNGAERDAAR